MEEMDVEVRDLEPGDVVLGVYTKGNSRDTFTSWTRRGAYKVLSKPVLHKQHSNIWCFNILTPQNSLVSEDRPDHVIFIVKRTHSQSKDFPHKCPRCGKNAYVGLFEVSHQFFSDCPARAG